MRRTNAWLVLHHPVAVMPIWRMAQRAATAFGAVIRCTTTQRDIGPNAGQTLTGRASEIDISGDSSANAATS
jgi:hypothetical protein